MNPTVLQRLHDEGWKPLSDGTFIDHIGSVYTRHLDGVDELGILTRPAHRNLSGAVHGAIIMAIFDRVMGTLVRSLHPGEPFATASMTVEFLRRVKVGDFVRAVPILVKNGRKAVFLRGEACVGDRLIGSASGVFMATSPTNAPRTLTAD